MLFSNQINASSVLAAQLQARGYCVQAEPGTPLHKLTSTYALAQNDVLPQGEKFEPNLKFILESSNAMNAHLDGLDVPQSDALDGLAKDIAPHVRQHMYFTKTVATPLMNDMAKAYSDSAVKYQFTPGNNEVVIYNAPLPVMDHSFKELVAQFASAPMGNVPSYVNLGLDSATMKKLCVEAIPGMEDQVAQWLATVGDKVDLFYTAAFSGSPDVQISLEPLVMGEDGFDAACYLFLATMALHNNPPDNVGMGLSKYNTVIQAIRVRVASRLRYLVEEFESFLETKTLVIGYNRQRIRVVGDVYKEFLDGGGNAGMLTTVARMNNPCRTLMEIAERKDEIEREQRKQNIMLSATADNQKYAVLRDLLVFCAKAEVGKAFNRIYPDCPLKEGVDPTWGNYINFQKELMDYVKNIRLEELTDVWGVCAKVVATCVFPHMACVGKMIYGMESAKKANPKITAEEASLLACCEYVFDYVIDQIAVIKASK